MPKNLFRGTTWQLRIGFFAFLLGLFGACLGFLGFYLGSRTISIIGYGICVMAIVIGFGAIGIGWLVMAMKIFKKLLKI